MNRNNYFSDLLSAYVGARNKSEKFDYDAFLDDFIKNYNDDESIETSIKSDMTRSILNQAYYCLSNQKTKLASTDRKAIGYAASMISNMREKYYEKCSIMSDEKYFYNMITDSNRIGICADVFPKLLGIGCDRPLTQIEIAKSMGMSATKINNIVHSTHFRIYKQINKDYENQLENNNYGPEILINAFIESGMVSVNVFKNLLNEYVKECNESDSFNYEEFANNFIDHYKPDVDTLEKVDIIDLVNSKKTKNLLRQAYYCLSNRKTRPAFSNQEAISYAACLITQMNDANIEPSFFDNEEFLYNVITDRRRPIRAPFAELLGVGYDRPLTINEVSRLKNKKVSLLMHEVHMGVIRLNRRMYENEYFQKVDESQAQFLVDKMAQGKDVLGENQPTQESNNKQLGFAMPWVLGILTGAVSVGLLMLGVFLSK